MLRIDKSVVTTFVGWKGKNSKFRNFHKKSHKMSKKFLPSSLPKKSCDVRAYPGVLRKIVTLSKKNISRSCLVIYFFCNPSHKTETGTAKRWGTTNNKPLGPIIIMGQKLDHIYCTLFCRYTAFLRLFVATANDAIMLSQNQFPEPNRHVLTFLLLCRITHIRSMGGDAALVRLCGSTTSTKIQSSVLRSLLIA